MDHSHHAYSDSANSSTTSRHTDTWDDTSPSGLVPVGSGGGRGGKIRLMCSYGGHIVPRPNDKTLCYLGGVTRIVVLDRRSTLSEFSALISETLVNVNVLFVIKYQLPHQDLDSLISVTSDEDLENMIEEYDRTVGGGGGGGGGVGPCRLRLFLFPVASSSIGSILHDSNSKSENWFVDALNGAILPSLCSDANSVNCLLGLDVAVPATPAADGEIKVAGIRSVPDSPLMETASSFGSASSNLHADGRAGVEEQFAGLMAAKGGDDVSAANPSGAGEATASARVSSEDERRPPPHKAVSLDSAAASDSPRDNFAPAIPRSAIYSDSIPPFASRPAAPPVTTVPGAVGDQKQRVQVHDPSLLLQMQQTEQQIHQFIPAGRHFIHPTPSGAAVHLTRHYIHHQQPPEQLDQHQYPQVYFVPVRPNPAMPSAVPQQALPTRTAAPAKAAGGGGGATATLQHQYVGYRQLGYEYVDPMQEAIYYTQPGGSPLAAASQYQTVTSAAAMAEAAVAPPPGAVESKQQSRS